VPPGQAQEPPAPEQTLPPLQSALVQQVLLEMQTEPHSLVPAGHPAQVPFVQILPLPHEVPFATLVCLQTPPDAQASAVHGLLSVSQTVPTGACALVASQL
jgi:hypothetical protein